jgi:hypothetical protein
VKLTLWHPPLVAYLHVPGPWVVCQRWCGGGDEEEMYVEVSTARDVALAETLAGIELDRFGCWTALDKSEEGEEGRWSELHDWYRWWTNENMRRVRLKTCSK